MKRRQFLTLLGGAAAAWPLVARAQQRPAMPVVGYLDVGVPEPSGTLLAAFRKGLSETGYVEGQNVRIEYRWAAGQYDRVPELFADLVRRRVTVIATPGNTPAAVAAKAATTTIPIVFAIGTDPVQVGLVANFNRPGGNVTGITSMNAELSAKRLGTLNEMVPGATRFAVLVNPNNPQTDAIVPDLQAAAVTLGRQIEILNGGTVRDIEVAFASVPQKRIEGLLVSPDLLFSNRRVQLATLAVRYALPTIFSDRQYSEAGGMMSYGSSIPDLYRQGGIYTGRVLRGEKPAELPVMRATKFELVINLATARALGITVPATLLSLADEVIE
jgi:putative ABC transport system substrate-binding protein